jgi:hypothetical protein
MEYLHQELNGLVLSQTLLPLILGLHITLIAELQHHIKVIRSFLEIIQSNDVAIIAALQYLNFLLE